MDGSRHAPQDVGVASEGSFLTVDRLSPVAPVNDQANVQTFARKSFQPLGKLMLIPAASARSGGEDRQSLD
jgi:hypothetical protein